MTHDNRWEYQYTSNVTNHEHQDVIDKAWDSFLDYIGVHKLKTPLSINEFNYILRVIDNTGEFILNKEYILKSLRYDSYAWPIVER